MLSPVCHIRIVAGFGHEGKSDDARKSRIFNNLERFRANGRAKARPLTGSVAPVRIKKPRQNKTCTPMDRPGLLLITRSSAPALELSESPIAAPQSSLWNEAGL
jgi:hypothetical protein